MVVVVDALNSSSEDGDGDGDGATAAVVFDSLPGQRVMVPIRCLAVVAAAPRAVLSPHITLSEDSNFTAPRNTDDELGDDDEDDDEEEKSVVSVPALLTLVPDLMPRLSRAFHSLAFIIAQSDAAASSSSSATACTT